MYVYTMYPPILCTAMTGGYAMGVSENANGNQRYRNGMLKRTACLIESCRTFFVCWSVLEFVGVWCSVVQRAAV